MSQPQIKLQKLPDTKPTKHTISVMPDLEADLEAYAKVYDCLLYTSPSPRDS